MNSGFDRAHFARAVFDAIAWSLRDVLVALEAVQLAPAELRVDGGLTNSPLLLQRCADVCGIPVVRAAQSEATAFGAAALAMLSLGLVNLDDVGDRGRRGHIVEPGTPPSAEEEERWLEALSGELARVNVA
jgi:glycerol kinase